MSDVKIIFAADCQPKINLFLNHQPIECLISFKKDKQGNYQIFFSADLAAENKLDLVIDNLTGYLKIVDIVVNEINFGLVTFLVTTVNSALDTQINTSGTISIKIENPIWEFWCQKMNAFNYRDYPLGSID